jgi:hypothetical protein
LGEALIPILAIKAAKAKQTTGSSSLIQPVESGFLDFFFIRFPIWHDDEACFTTNGATCVEPSVSSAAQLAIDSQLA